MNTVVPLWPNQDVPQPPVAIEVERSLLGTVLQYNVAFHRVAGIVRAEHFALAEHEHIYAVIGDLVGRDLRADVPTVWNAVKDSGVLNDVGGASYLPHLVGQYAMLPENAESYATIIRDTSAKRRLMALCQETIQTLAAGDWAMSVGDISAAVLSGVQDIAGGDNLIRLRSRREVMASVVDALKVPMRGYSTGLHRFDLAMGGAGLLPGRCYGIGARKKAGKTALGATISFNLDVQETRHLFVCLEMSAEEIEQRKMARQMGENSVKFLQQNAHGFVSQAGEVAMASPDFTEWLDAHSLTFDGLKGALAMAVSRKKIKGFFLDYLQLVRGKPSRQSTAEFLDEVSQWLANFCRRENVWGVVFFQLNQTDNVRGGEGPMMAFDQVYFLCRDEEENPQPGAWLEQKATRYTRYSDVGSAARPALWLNEKGTYFEETNP